MSFSTLSLSFSPSFNRLPYHICPPYRYFRETMTYEGYKLYLGATMNTILSLCFRKKCQLGFERMCCFVAVFLVP